MEKTMNIIDIIRSAIKEWTGKKDQVISDEKIISGEISDDEFTGIAVGLSPEVIATLLKTRNGRGADKLDSNDKKDKNFVKKVSTPFAKSNEKTKSEKDLNREIEEKDLNREI